MPFALPHTQVLLVEPDDDTRMLIAFALERHGALVTDVASGRDAVALASTVRPDVLVTDLVTVDIDGFELLRALRVQPGLAAVPAVALTARDHDRQRSLDAGFAKHLAKPSATLDLVAAIASVILGAPGTLRHVRTVVEQISALSRCRYTSLLRFADDGSLVSIWTHDRDRPAADPFPIALPVEASYCVLIREAGGPVAIEDAHVDERVVAHPKREQLRTYAGVPVRDGSGNLYGTLCCYDEAAHQFPARLLPALEAAAIDLVDAVQLWSEPA